MTRRFVPPICQKSGQPEGRSLHPTLSPTTRNPFAVRKERTRRAKEKSISILLIEDNRLFRMGLSALLEKQEGLRLLASAGRPEGAAQPDLGQRPDVILLDLGLGDLGSLRVVRGIRATYPDSKLIVMGLIPVRSEILSLVKEGVSGFVLKDASIGDFVASIRAVAAGQRAFPSSLTDSLLSQIVEAATAKGMVDIADVKMTSREREIVDLIADGLSNKEIAKKLSIATDTVKSHVHNILEKLSLRSRVEVALRARVRAPSGN